MTFIFSDMQSLTFVFASWPAFFINVYSCRTCPRLEGDHRRKGIWVRMNGSLSLPRQAFLISSSPPLPAYSPPSSPPPPPTPPSPPLPILRPPCPVKAIRLSIHAWSTLPVWTEHAHTYIPAWPLYFWVANTHQGSVRLSWRAKWCGVCDMVLVLPDSASSLRRCICLWYCWVFLSVWFSLEKIDK